MKQLIYDAFQKLGKLSSEGKVVSAWILQSGEPDRDLILSGANVIGWRAACGTHPIDLAEITNPPQYDETLFLSKGGVLFNGTSQSLTGLTDPAGWPTSTEDLYLLAAVRQDYADSNVSQGTVICYGDGASSWRALQRNGDTGASVIRLKVGSNVATGSNSFNNTHTIAGHVDIGGNSTAYLDGVSDGVVTSATAGLPLTRVRLGASANAIPQLFWSGAIAAAAVLNSSANIADMLELESELRARL